MIFIGFFFFSFSLAFNFSNNYSLIEEEEIVATAGSESWNVGCKDWGYICTPGGSDECNDDDC